MKNTIGNIMIFAFMALFISACDLDLTPSTSIGKDEAFETLDDAMRFSNGLHSKFRNCQYGIFSYTTEVQGEFFNAGKDYGNRNGSPHRMDESFTTSDYSLRDVWRPSYSLIVNINTFIENADKIELKTDAEKGKMADYLGYAYYFRASIYHDLVRRFAKDYEPSTASSDLGVPLILKYDLTEKPARATIADVYIQIEKDIASAYTNLAGKAGKAGSQSPTIDAVKALDARVKLYMHKYDQAASLAKELISSGKYILPKTLKEMKEEWVDDSGSECILQLFTNMDESVQTNDVYLRYSSSSKIYNPDFIPTKTCIEMYEENDLRYKQWFKKLPVTISGVSGNLVLFAKYWGNPEFEVAPKRYYKHKPKVARIGEMYLIRAEALLLQSTPNVAEAKVALNTLQEARGASKTEATMENIQKEWAKEMIGEGFGVDCLKRWKKGFSGRIPQDNIFVVTGESFDKIKVTAGYKKLVWAIPDTDINVNPNLVQNEGW